MNLKTFQADSMAAALAQVKRELGAEAVILHTRTFSRGGLFGFGRKRVVEITAGTELQLAGRGARARPNGRPSPAPRSAAEGPAAHAGDRLLREVYGGAARSTSAPAQPGADHHCPANPGPPVGNAPGRLATAVAAAPTASSTGPSGDPAVASELRQLREMVTRVIKATDNHVRHDLPDQLFDKYLSLLQQELAAELAEQVVREARRAVADPADEAEVDRAIRDALAQLVPSGEALNATSAERQTDGRPQTIALIGPTGVGKTTTLAKLAATYKLREKRNVALVTIDTYRIAAVDQLRSYAQIIGVPLHVAQSPLELKQVMNRCRGCDAVLIDTAGRSQRDDAKLTELRAFLDAADPHEVHLVLASTATQRVLEEAVERFSAIRTDRIIFTKLDEAVSFGVLVNIIRQVNKQLSFFTTGQDVPHDIERGEGGRLADLIINGELKLER